MIRFDTDDERDVGNATFPFVTLREVHWAAARLGVSLTLTQAHPTGVDVSTMVRETSLTVLVEAPAPDSYSPEAAEREADPERWATKMRLLLEAGARAFDASFERLGWCTDSAGVTVTSQPTALRLDPARPMPRTQRRTRSVARVLAQRDQAYDTTCGPIDARTQWYDARTLTQIPPEPLLVGALYWVTVDRRVDTVDVARVTEVALPAEAPEVSQRAFLARELQYDEPSPAQLAQLYETYVREARHALDLRAGAFGAANSLAEILAHATAADPRVFGRRVRAHAERLAFEPALVFDLANAALPEGEPRRFVRDGALWSFRARDVLAAGE